MSLTLLPETSWSPEQAAHLLNRAGFGGTPGDINRLHQLGLDRAVDQLLDFSSDVSGIPLPAWADTQYQSSMQQDLHSRMESAPDEEGKRGIRRANRQVNNAWITDLRAWWLHRMRHSPAPLQEKMTLFLHGHFCTGFRKVKSAYAMLNQNQTFRQHAGGNWRDLLNAVTVDPAMLIYLDGIKNTKKAPNENYAREVMELFTLGEGHYSEDDIREAARAYTGWKTDRTQSSFVWKKWRHDHGSKTVFGKSGSFDSEDITDLLLEQNQAARWICSKLWTFFAYENPEPGLIDLLAASFRRSNYALKPLLKDMFRSKAFYAERAFRTQVKSPVQWLVSTLTYLEAPLPDPSMSLQLLKNLGQELFEPPNVKGWDGGISWVTTSSMALRYEYAERFAKGWVGQKMREKAARKQVMMMDSMEEMGAAARMPDPDSPWRAPHTPPFLNGRKILPEDARSSRASMLASLQWRLYQSQLREKDREMFREFFNTLPPAEKWTSKTFSRAVQTLMSTPQFQLT